MLCENCHQREAAVKFTQVVGSEKQTLNLCTDCAEKQQFDNHLIDISKVFGKIIIAILGEHLVSQTLDVSLKKDDKKTCVQCGISWGAFQKTGRLGCSGCYDSFLDPLKVLLRRLHGTNRHIGPKIKTDEKQKLSSLHTLRKKLQSAIQKEDYEKAAELRDQIRECERKQK
jgi:protein arginine kinase activator